MEKIKELRMNTSMAEEFFAQRLAYTLGPVELKSMSEKDNVKIIDVRARVDFDLGHIPGAICIPKSELLEKLQLLSKEHVHLVYCYNAQCHLAAAAAFTLAKNGYPVMEMEGGFDVWVNDFKFEVEKL